MSGAPRILIADDHAPTRYGVRLALERGGMEVCAEVADAHAALEQALLHKPDACLLDVHMPGGGPAAASSITTRLPDTVVLMLSVSAEVDDLLESLRRGASGYLLKDMNPERLPIAVNAALHGESSVPQGLLPHLIAELRDFDDAIGQPHTLRGLTRRQIEVLRLLRAKASTGEIASRLMISEVTVRRHISTIAGRLGASSRADLLRIAALEGDSAPDSGAHGQQ